MLHALILLGLISLIIFGEEYKLWGSLLCSFFNLLPFHTSTVQTFSSAPCSPTPSICVFFVTSETKFHTRYKYGICNFSWDILTVQILQNTNKRILSYLWWNYSKWPQAGEPRYYHSVLLKQCKYPWLKIYFIRKRKLKFFLALIKHDSMRRMGTEAWLHAFLTSVLDESEWSSSCCSRFAWRERFSGTHYTQRCQGPPGRFGEERSSLPLPGIELRWSVVQPIV
jgi:hypothetical protein